MDNHIFTKQRYMNIPVNYRDKIDNTIVGQFKLEQNIRDSLISKCTPFKAYIYTQVINHSILTMDLCFQLANGQKEDGNTVSWSATSPSMVHTNFLEQSSILKKLNSYLPAGSTVISAKKSKIGQETFNCMVAKCVDDIDFRMNNEKDIILFLRNEIINSEQLIFSALIGYFSSHAQWVEPNSLDKAVKSFIKTIKEGVKGGEIELEVYTKEREFFNDIEQKEEHYSKYEEYRDGIASSLKNEIQGEIFKRVYDIQMVAFYRNCTISKANPTQLMPVLYGKQNTGKTYSIRAPFMWLGEYLSKSNIMHDSNLADLPSESSKQACFNSLVVLFDDLSHSQSKKSVSELKEILSKNQFTKVGKFIEKNIGWECLFICFGTTNVQDWLPDTENRRCPTFEVTTRIRHAPRGYCFKDFFYGIKYLAEDVYKDIHVDSMREKIVDSILAMHKGNSENTAPEVDTVINALINNKNTENTGNRAVLTKKAIYAVLGRNNNSKNQIQQYLQDNNSYRTYNINGRSIKGVLLQISTSCEVQQEVLSKKIPATFIFEDIVYSTSEYYELLRFKSTRKTESDITIKDVVALGVEQGWIVK